MRGVVPRLGALAVALALAAPALAAQDTIPVRRDTIRQQRDTIPRREMLPWHDTIPPLRDTIPVATVPAAPDRVIRVCAGGDVTLGNNLDAAWAARAARNLVARWGRSAHPDSLLAPLKPLVADADVVMLNVESAIGEGPAPRKCGAGSTSCYAFRSPPGAALAVRNVAPHASVVGNMANNHARDAGPAGFAETQRNLETAGVHVTGASDAATPVATASGDTVAFLGFYTSAASPDARNLAEVRRLVARAKARWPVVIVSTHMGAEGVRAQRTRDATEMFLGRIDRGNPVAFARTAIEAGASVVFGHGPHVMRAAQWHGEQPAFYSLGNLVTYGPFSNGEPGNRGAIACVALTPQGAVRGASLRSTQQLAPGVVVADTRRRAAALVDSLGRLDFPRDGLRVAADGAVLIPFAVAPELPVDSIAAPQPPVNALPASQRPDTVPRPR